MTRYKAPHRTRQEIAHDRAEIMRLHRMGKPVREIAVHLSHLSRHTIYKDLQRITRDWRAAAIIDMDEARGQELTRLDLVEHEAWAAWERSQQPQTKRRRTSHGRGTQRTTDVLVEHTQPVGDPRYLDTALRCVEARSKILGLAVTKVAATDTAGRDTAPLITVEELRRRAQRAREYRERMQLFAGTSGHAGDGEAHGADR